MGLLEKINQARRPTGRGSATKAFVQPPFWVTEARRFPLLSTTSLSSNEEKIENDFDAYIELGYKGDGVVFSAIAARQHIFSQARFLWREFRNGTPGELFSTPELDLLRRPAPGQTTSNLLSRMDVTASLAGNFYAVRIDDQGRVGRSATGPGARIAPLRPDWVTILIGSQSGDANAPDAKVISYIYKPVVSNGDRPPEGWIFTPDQICHYAPEPDPALRFRGMSWLTPIIREIQADRAATEHKAKFFENGATPGIAIKFDKDTSEDAFDEFVGKFKAHHQGAWNAYKTLFLADGADVVPLSMDLRQLDFKATQGAGETRIAMASGVHPVILGASEGLQGSSLNQGNFGAARRLVADKTMRHLWEEAASSLETLLTPPNPASQLWFDTRDVAFLREDARDLAEIQRTQAVAIRQLLEVGYTADAAVEFVASGDLRRLIGAHTGLPSVQLQSPADLGGQEQ